MHHLARSALRPALIAGRAGVDVTSAVCASLAALEPWPSCTAARQRLWSSSSSKPNDEALRKAERMVELMGENPQLQQMILSAMPAPFRNAEMVKQMFQDPGMRKRIAEMMASRGFSIPDHLLQRMTPGAMDETFSRAQRLGIDPSAMFGRLMSHPGLLAQLQQPRVMAAFLDIAEDPARQAKYEGDKELLEVVFKAREILGTAKKPPIPTTATLVEDEAPSSTAATGGTDSSTTSTTSSSTAAPEATASLQPPPPGQPPRAESAAAASAAPGGTNSSDDGSAASAPGDAGGGGAEANPLVSLMRTDPKAARWLNNPQVMAALAEINKRPWKTVKYVFNREVMEAFKDLSNLIRGSKL